MQMPVPVPVAASEALPGSIPGSNGGGGGLPSGTILYFENRAPDGAAL